MKIGIVTGGHQKTSTGIGNYIDNIISNLPTQPENIHIIRHPNGYDYGIPNQIIPIAPKWSNMMFWSWATYIQKGKFSHLDIVHTPSLCLFPKKPHKNYILTIHDIIFKIFPEYCTSDVVNYANRYLSNNLNFADKIIAVSNATKNDLIQYFNVIESKITVIYEGASNIYKPLNKEELTEIIEKYKLSKPFILYIGTIEPRKNIPLIIHAFSRCIKKNYDIEFVIAGGLGWNYQIIFELIDKLGLTNRIKLLGYVPEEDLPKLYNAARVFVFPSFYEGFGLPPLEAMQCGTPVITSNTSSLPEVVGKGGLMIKPDDVKGLTYLLERIFFDDDYYWKQKEYGLQRSKLFSWKKSANRTFEIYEEILNK